MADRVTFDPNTPVKLTFAYDGGKEFPSQFDNSIQTMYSFTDGRVLFAPADLAVKVNWCEPKRGDTLWITKRVQCIKGRNKNKRLTSWEVSREEPGVVQRNGYRYQPSGSAEEMGIEESDLERQLRESREIKERAATRQQARENVARMPEPAETPLQKAWEREMVERKPPETAIAATSQPNGRPNWYAPVVEQTKMLVDALAEVRVHAEKHGQRVSFDDCEKLLVTCLIGKQRQRA